MKDNSKINVAAYLKDLNEITSEAIKHNRIRKEYLEQLTCKKLAEKCNVTPATISNLTTSSKFSLIHKIADEILDSYYPYFSWSQDNDKKYRPDKLIFPKVNTNYIIMCLTEYYSEEN